MNSVFAGFSEADLQRIKSEEVAVVNGADTYKQVLKLEKLDFKSKKKNQYQSLPPKQNSDVMHNSFEKCMPPMSKDIANSNLGLHLQNKSNDDGGSREEKDSSTNITPDVIKFMENYTEDKEGPHKVKLEELQIRQKLMEEQNKKRKEMLSKALADRTKQTEEEVQKLEKIKKELQFLDGQFSQDVAVLRKKIDQACVHYSEVEKQYLKVEKEFLQAKINLQKEREKKELLTEHLCALITHNETRKAQKLETLMLELANDRKKDSIELPSDGDETPVIIDGVDEKTGKMVEIGPNVS
ncbi:RAB6-interacting golgin [Leptidea sinapis]|uniref:RAB6-interacting golgin n=1 Tax=Leptidea sinapis TaxID=189913 RepID=UPI0021C292B7|nr:RAB6-interacting golgin [Leptidea sinapis]